MHLSELGLGGPLICPWWPGTRFPKSDSLHARMLSRIRFGLLRMKENLSSHIIPLFLPVFFPAFFSPQSLGWQKAKEVEGGRMGKRAQIGRQGFTERLKSVHECMKHTEEESQTSSTFPETMWSAHRSLTVTDILTAGAGSWYFLSLFLTHPSVFVTICDYDCMSERPCHSCHRIPQAGMTAQRSLWTLSPYWKTSLREGKCCSTFNCQFPWCLSRHLQPKHVSYKFLGMEQHL